MTRWGMLAVIGAGLVTAFGHPLCAETNAVATGTMVDYLPFVGKSTNDLPADAVAALQQLRAGKVATPDATSDLIFQSLTEDEKNFIRIDARSTRPRAVRLWRMANGVNQDIIAGDLVWVVRLWRVDRPQERRVFFIPARTGKIITPNQVPEDTARKLADPQH